MSVNIGDIPLDHASRVTQRQCMMGIRRLLSDEDGRLKLRKWISWKLRSGSVTGSRNEELTDEIFQEVWVRALVKEGAFDPTRGDGHAWLRKIAARRISDEFRANRNSKVTCAKCFDEPFYESDSGDEVRSDPDISRVQEAVTSLSKAYQKVYEERFVKRKGGRELAEALGCKTLGAERARVFRFKKAFQKAFFAY